MVNIDTPKYDVNRVSKFISRPKAGIFFRLPRALADLSLRSRAALRPILEQHGGWALEAFGRFAAFALRTPHSARAREGSQDRTLAGDQTSQSDIQLLDVPYTSGCPIRPLLKKMFNFPRLVF